jgi:hypothetical protein
LPRQPPKIAKVVAVAETHLSNTFLAGRYSRGGRGIFAPA